MIENQELKIIDISALEEEVSRLFSEDCRMVQISCAKIDSTLELSYSFDKDGKFQSLRVVLPSDVPNQVPSVSHIYFCAFLYENEIHDLYGVDFEGLVLDFKGNLYRTQVKTPFNLPEIRKEEAK